MNMMNKDAAHLAYEGVTLIGSLPISAQAFYQRLIEDSLRLSTEPVSPRPMTGLPGDGLTVAGPGCRGYLLGIDGEEAPESEIYDFFKAILRPGDAVSISGKYVQPGGLIIESDATFLCAPRGIMSAERRMLLRPDGSTKALRMRSDIQSENVTPFTAPSELLP